MRKRAGATSSNETLVIRGFALTQRRLKAIQRVTLDLKSSTRTQISLTLCRKFKFRQQNGWLKDRAMRDILRRMESLKLIRLPPSRKLKQNPTAYSYDQSQIDTSPISGVDFAEIQLVRVKTREQCALWDYLVGTHHYLGRKTIVGRNLRQMVFVGQRPLACLGWCDPSLKLASRDSFLAGKFSNGWASVNHGTNNTRFLILPWVNVRNLASKVLSLAQKDAKSYWRDYYNMDLAWAESFVDPTRFIGTCYLAANWFKVGQTVGTARSGFAARRREHGVAKDILVYVFRDSQGRPIAR